MVQLNTFVQLIQLIYLDRFTLLHFINVFDIPKQNPDFQETFDCKESRPFLSRRKRINTTTFKLLLKFIINIFNILKKNHKYPSASYWTQEQVNILDISQMSVFPKIRSIISFQFCLVLQEILHDSPFQL